ncbi:MAG: ArsR/SmtB family transcription factor [Candidatus Heimdallarchaeota archaeon]
MEKKSTNELYDILQDSFEDVMIILKALGTPNRLKIMILLLGGPRTFQEIGDNLEIGRTALSNHLKSLKKALLIDKIHHGFYRITNNGSDYLQGIILAYEESQTNEAKEREALHRKQMMDTFLHRKK